MNEVGMMKARLALLALLAIFGRHGIAQQIGTTVASAAIDSSYSESNSINWSVMGPGWSASINNQAPSPLGQNSPNNGTSGGFGFGGNGVSGSLGFQFAQGSDRTLSGTSQSMTNLNGNPGSFFSGSVRPFVIGVTPVVGGYPTGQSDIANIAAASQQQRLSSIAQGNLDRRHEKLRAYLRRAERAESESNWKMARANYGLAIRLADEPLRSMIQTKLSQGSATKR